MNSEPIIREFEIEATGQKRQKVDSPAIFQILQGRRLPNRSNAVFWSTFSHWNEAGVRQKSDYSDQLLDAVDWKRVRRIPGQIHRQIKTNLAVARLGTRPVLPTAFEEMEGASLNIWRGPGLVGRDSADLEVFGASD